MSVAWCRQATSHYLSLCWPRSLSPYEVKRPQWVDKFYSLPRTWPLCLFPWLELLVKICMLASKTCLTYSIDGPATLCQDHIQPVHIMESGPNYWNLLILHNPLSYWDGKNSWAIQRDGELRQWAAIELHRKWDWKILLCIILCVLSETIDAVVNFEQTPSGFLRRQKVTRQQLFQYLVRQDQCPNPKADKDALVNSVLDLWESRGAKVRFQVGHHNKTDMHHPGLIWAHFTNIFTIMI